MKNIQGNIYNRIKYQYILLFLFVAMLSLGLSLGGFGKVLANGAVICLDCIGLY
ncbi:MAG: hypothetical protein JXA49_04880 [Actinobacteria bacterium]|nr:hypothetical protein [Actinomycetota bacterium]